MNIDDIPLKELLKERSRFCYYQNGELVYLTTSNFRFTIPIEELGTARLNVQEPNRLLMKWIRAQQERNQAIKESLTSEEAKHEQASL